MNLNNKRVLVIGSGISGIGACDLLESNGALPILFDENVAINQTELYHKFKREIKVEIILGNLPKEVLETVELAVISPGVPCDADLVVSLKKHKIPIWGEIELAFQFEKGTVVAITGTNGKTTTTTLVGEMVRDYFENSFVVGNIGIPYTMSVSETTNDSITVAEISSFQLETIESFKPKVSAILNITPDHLNRHYTMENYAKAKQEIGKNQTKQDYCILNYDNPYTKEFGNQCTATVIWFSSKEKVDQGLYLEAETIYLVKEGITTKLMAIQDTKLVGNCNYENIMAAIGMGLCLNIPLESLLATIKKFKAVEHRIEFVATKKGVDYYNDSKGTNPDAAIQGILAMTKPTILIGGGYDKESTYDEWIEAFGDKVKLLILIGQTAKKIEACAKKHDFHKIRMAENLEEVMQICENEANYGDAVLLSPACASWGMFPNYEVRGNIFKNLVHSIKE